MPDLLSKFSAEDIREFKSDFMRVLNMAKHMDEDWGSGNNRFYRNKPKFETYLGKFSGKYILIHCVPTYNIQDKVFHILFPKEKSVRDVLVNAVLKMSGLTAIGHSPFSWVSVRDETLAKQVHTIADRAYAFFSDETIILEWNERCAQSELIYSKDSIINPAGPEFRLCCYYGLLDGFQRSINLEEEAKTFEFGSTGVGRTGIGPVK